MTQFDNVFGFDNDFARWNQEDEHAEPIDNRVNHFEQLLWDALKEDEEESKPLLKSKKAKKSKKPTEQDYERLLLQELSDDDQPDQSAVPERHSNTTRSQVTMRNPQEDLLSEVMMPKENTKLPIPVPRSDVSANRRNVQYRTAFGTLSSNINLQTKNRNISHRNTTTIFAQNNAYPSSVVTMRHRQQYSHLPQPSYSAKVKISPMSRFRFNGYSSTPLNLTRPHIISRTHNVYLNK